MKIFFLVATLLILAYNIVAEINDIYNPSDSGDMKWLNYEITKFNASHGDIKSKYHLLNHYLYNNELNDFPRGIEIGGLIMGIIHQGYGGVKNGGDGVVVDLIDECSRKRLVTPSDVADSLKIIKTNGGGLTPLGQDIETRWQKGDFPSCPPVVPKVTHN